MDTYLNSDIESISRDKKLRSIPLIYRIGKKSNIRSWLWGIFILLIVVLLLPWTQNIRARGRVTALRQEERPQQLNTVIAGTVKKWYVKEGDIVNRGDTLLQLGEVKVDYFDTGLLYRTNQQIVAKEMSLEGYKSKAAAASDQVYALNEGKKLRLQVLENRISQQLLKVNSDEADLEAAKNELTAYSRQINAARQMLDSGAISLVEFEKRKINYQNAIAKNNSASNKLMQSRQELANLRIEQQASVQDFNDKIAKAEADKFSSLSTAAGTEAEISKLRNLYSSYDVRNKLYYILAPQAGQITKAKKAGLGEFVEEGEMIVEIVPNRIQYAVELFVRPMDLPLVNKGQKVRFVFDGFPAIVFSGWPGNSYGTFGGRVLAVEKSVSENGKFRVLIVEDPADRKWPYQLSMGTGAEGIMLLKDVKIYYELWRNINGFPPQFYKPEDTNSSAK